MHVHGLNLKRINNPSLAQPLLPASLVPVFRQGNYNEPFVFNRLIHTQPANDQQNKNRKFYIDMSYINLLGHYTRSFVPDFKYH